MLGIPRHIEVSGVAHQQLTYAWDEWSVGEYFHFLPERQYLRLAALTNNANLGLCLASAEWVRTRFSVLDHDSIPINFIEAAWAGATHRAYCRYTEVDADEWRGPVRGPLAIMVTILNDALYGLGSNPEIATRACEMLNLANHILPSTDSFDAWWEACLNRLEQFHTKAIEINDEEPDLFENFPNQGSPVPREAFDPKYPYDPVLAPSLWDAYLRNLDPASNVFLPSIKDLSVVDDLPAAPYRYLRNP